eukprot:5823743-Amphidinium_carterae.1
MAEEKIALQGVDSFVAGCRHWHRSMPGVGLLGKTLDLQDAYRQLPVARDHYKFSVIAVWQCESKSVAFYVMKALPFGAVAS